MSERSVTTFAAGLRALADWYEAHPDMLIPSVDIASEWKVFGFDSKEDAASVIAALGSCRKEYTDNGLLYIKRDFGAGVVLSFVFSREQVCRKKVLGTEQIPERVIPAHEREIVEWECEPILAEESA